MRPSRRALLFLATVPLVPSLVLAHACSLSEFESGATATSAVSTSASTSGSGGASGDGDTGGPPTCPPKMAEIHPGAGPSFCIDRYEVTRGDYASFLKVADAGPKPPEVCAWNTFDPAPTLSPRSLPVDHVDWCDAYAYCASSGKRLCGSVKGGSVSFVPDLRSSIADQWQAACSNGVTTLFPYGDSFILGRCSDCVPEAGCAPDGIPEAGPDGQPSTLHSPAVAAVGAFEGCVTNGVYDLSGNVAEWEDSCLESEPDSTGKRHPENDTCSVRGGSFKLPNAKVGSSCLACSTANCKSNKQLRNRRYDDVGFRCCKDLE
jgi:formylglycine-generating enzyme